MKQTILAVVACVAAVLGLVAPAGAREADVASCSHVEQDGSRTLCHEAIVAAPAREVWRLFATTEGLGSWVAPVAAIDLRIGGMWEASYRRDAHIGDPGNIRNRVLSYVPEHMLSIAVDSAPPGFPEPDLIRNVWTVIELLPAGENMTRVRVSMLGYGAGPHYDRLYAMFDEDNAFTMRKLAERIATGPIDWAAKNKAPGEGRP